MNHEIKRATGLLVLEAVNSNPNGDPDRDGEPRQRDNGRGEISPVSFKRKLRDLIEQNDKDEHDTPFFKALPEKFSGKEHEKQYLILEHRGRNRSQIKEEMRENSLQSGRRKFVERYWDARVFGNTFLEEGEDNFIRTGVVQFGMGISLAPVEIIRQTNTNKAGVESGKDRGMAPMAYRIVDHGVYCMPFFVNPNQAEKSGCTADDIELLKLLIPHAYEQNRSAIRPDVRIRHAWYIEHKSILGSCPEHLSTALTPEDRGNTIDRIRRRLADPDDADWTLVATSCVEAGVDFSFRTGFREISSLLSLLQAAGRVNRHGRNTEAVMWSFSLQDDSMLPKNPALDVSAAVLRSYFQKRLPITPELSTRSMQDELVRDDSCMSAICDFAELEAAQQFRTLAQKFRVIDQKTVLAVPDDSMASAIAEGRASWQELQRHAVSVRKEKIVLWHLREIADGIYQWTLGYDSFLGYMHGVLLTE